MTNKLAEPQSTKSEVKLMLNDDNQQPAEYGEGSE
jgi:hypothetical protein